MFIQLDVTPVSHMPAALAEVRSYEDLATPNRAISDRTRFSHEYATVDIFSSATTSNTVTNTINTIYSLDEPGGRAKHLGGSHNSISRNIQAVESESDRVAQQRIKLFAAKSVRGKETSEILARLEILNNRMSDLSPRVTSVQVKFLEDANNQLKEMRAVREKIDALLNL